jgi:hypothetical protein
MKRKIVIFLLAIIITFSGCITPNPPKFQYSNNIVTIENYNVLTTNPYPGSSTSISFWVKNNGDKIVYVTVDFFNVPNNLNPVLSCEGSVVQGLKCENIKIEPFDLKPVKLDLTMPKQDILSPIPYTIAFSISYNWNGYRSANIPIIDGITKTQPTSQFSESQASYGPITVNFYPPVGRTYNKDNQVITEHWGVVGRPFEVKMRFTHIGNPQGIIEQPLIIPKDSISINSINIAPAKDVYCAFRKLSDSSQACDQSDLNSGNCVYPRDLELPGELVCNFNTVAQPVSGELVGIVSVNYTYTYRFVRTETIIEQPPPK